MQLGLPWLHILSNLFRTPLCSFLVLFILSKVQKAKHSSCKHTKTKVNEAMTSILLCSYTEYFYNLSCIAFSLYHYMNSLSTCMSSITAVFLFWTVASLQSVLNPLCFITVLVVGRTGYRSWKRVVLLSFLCYYCVSAVELTLEMKKGSVRQESNMPILNTTFSSAFLWEISLLSAMFGNW